MGMQAVSRFERWPLSPLRPLLPLSFFAVAMGRDMPALIEAVDTGRFGHVWDISSGARHGGSAPQKNRRRELRVFYRDGMALLNEGWMPRLTYEECLEQILPPGRGFKGTELQRRWNCGPDLIHDLAESGLIEVERERGAAHGPRATRVYSRESLHRFLANRAIGCAARN